MRVGRDRRMGEGWRAIELVGPSDRLDRDAVDVAIDLGRIYFGVPALRPVEPPEIDGAEHA